MSVPYIPPPIDPAFFEQIGRLCAAWSHLEFRIEKEIWRLLGVKADVGQFATRRLDAKGRWDLLLELAESREPEFYSQIKARNGEMADFARNRNLIVHGLLGWDWHNHCPTFTISKGAMAGKPQRATIELIVATREGIQNLANWVSPSQVVGPS